MYLVMQQKKDWKGFFFLLRMPKNLFQACQLTLAICFKVHFAVHEVMYLAKKDWRGFIFSTNWRLKSV